MIKVLSIIIAMYFFIGCTPKQQSQPSSQQTLSTAIKNVSLVSKVEQSAENRVPNFFWKDENGKEISFAEFSKGSAVLVNFWATWCPPCRKELPDLISLNEELKNTNLKIIGISTDKGTDILKDVAQFSDEYKINYPIIIDNGELEKAFGGVRALPTTFFVDKNETIVKKMIGLQTKETFQKELTALQ